MQAAAPPKVASAPPRLCTFRRGLVHGWGENQGREALLPLSGPDGLVACQNQGDGLAGSDGLSWLSLLPDLAAPLASAQLGWEQLMPHQRP